MALHHLKIGQTAHVLYKNIANVEEKRLDLGRETKIMN